MSTSKGGNEMATKTGYLKRSVNPQMEKNVPYLPGPMTKDIAAKYEMDPARVIKLSSNRTPGSSSFARAKLIEDGRRASLYPDAEARELRAALAQILNIRPENIVVGPALPL